MVLLSRMIPRRSRPGPCGLTGLLVAVLAVELAAQTVPTRLTPQPGRSLLVNLRRETRLEYALTAQGMREEHSREEKVSIQAVDTVERFDGRLQSGTRRLLVWEAEIDGALADPPYTGLELTCRRKGDRFAPVPGSGWILPMPDLVRLARQAPSVGLVLPFPEETAVGAPVTVSLAPLASLLLDDEGTFSEARCDLKIGRVDAATGAVFWEGKAHLVETRALAGVETVLDYDLTCAIEQDRSGNRIASLRLDGKATLAGGDDVLISGEGRVRVSVTTALGTAVDRALRKKPKPRRNVWSLEEFGVTFQLPSLFARMADADGKVRFQHVQEDPRGGNATLTLWMEPAEGTTPEEIFAAYTKKLVARDIAPEEDRATAPLVQGHSYAYSSETDGRRLQVELDLYPAPPDILLVRFEAPAASFKTLRKDFLRMRRTLKALEANER